MTGTSHTPGPWSTNGTFVWLTADRERIRQDGSALAIEGPSDHALIGSDEWRANARLIASAPEMLAALRNIGSVLSQKPVTKKDDELWSAFSQVVAAVHKATGGTP